MNHEIREICTLVAKMFNELAIEDRTDWTAEEVAPQANIFRNMATKYFEMKDGVKEWAVAQTN